MPLSFVKDLKYYLNSFMEANSYMVASMISRNKLIEQVLVLVYSLAKFGYYGDAEDIKRLLDPLMKLLDGRTDLPFPVNADEST